MGRHNHPETDVQSGCQECEIGMLRTQVDLLQQALKAKELTPSAIERLARWELVHKEMHRYQKEVGNSVCELCEAVERVSEELGR